MNPPDRCSRRRPEHRPPERRHRIVLEGSPAVFPFDGPSHEVPRRRPDSPRRSERSHRPGSVCGPGASRVADAIDDLDVGDRVRAAPLELSLLGPAVHGEDRVRELHLALAHPGQHPLGDGRNRGTGGVELGEEDARPGADPHAPVDHRVDARVVGGLVAELQVDLEAVPVRWPALFSGAGQRARSRLAGGPGRRRHRLFAGAGRRKDRAGPNAALSSALDPFFPRPAPAEPVPRYANAPGQGAFARWTAPLRGPATAQSQLR